MTEPTGDWQPTACVLCECNCGIVVQATRPCGWTTTRTTATA